MNITPYIVLFIWNNLTSIGRSEIVYTGFGDLISYGLEKYIKTQLYGLGMNWIKKKLWFKYSYLQIKQCLYVHHTRLIERIIIVIEMPCTWFYELIESSL